MSAATAKAARLARNEQAKVYNARWREKQRQRQQAIRDDVEVDLNTPRPVTLPRVAFLSGEISR